MKLEMQRQGLAEMLQVEVEKLDVAKQGVTYKVSALFPVAVTQDFKADVQQFTMRLTVPKSTSGEEVRARILAGLSQIFMQLLAVSIDSLEL